jgi:cell division septum initiation protein DivIVA
MAGQISVEDAFPTFQKKCRELFEANLLLQAQVDTLERQLATAQEEIAQLRGQPQPAAEPYSATEPDPAR